MISVNKIHKVSPLSNIYNSGYFSTLYDRSSHCVSISNESSSLNSISKYYYTFGWARNPVYFINYGSMKLNVFTKRLTEFKDKRNHKLINSFHNKSKCIGLRYVYSKWRPYEHK